MTSIHLESNQDRYTISIDKNAVDKAWMIKLIERLRMEELAHQLNFDESVEELGEQIKADWWAKNKSRFINE
ncbi:hypothetical protein [Arsenicibacter rosenii]|uniref:Uncharacterized protein n=1 Tax=Arsenicibacter rosenii TaxID=1750698 RepID=A0A1S2VH38_9BACT|nr:hypothetical protein [Arsenicibacter rosenii]OIN58053.1 hypothetical protein BLX24_16110 [Arsenicibacter rosenii]